MQRSTLILRYGIGPVRARSGREAALLLDVSRGRVRLLVQRGVRALSNLGPGAACRGSGLERTTVVALYGLVTDTPAGAFEELPATLEAGVLLANAASEALDDGGEAAVAGARESGVRESGGAQRARAPAPGEDGPVASAGPSIGDPFDGLDSGLGNPFLLVLLAIVVACLASAAREFKRAVR